jgi:N-terminal domain of (some) glycogen debranching enzymes
MSFKVHVGPPQIAIHQGQTVLVSEPDGQITWPSKKGLYLLGTRVVSNWAIYANGEPWELLNGGSVGSISHQPEVLQQTGRIRTAFPRKKLTPSRPFRLVLEGDESIASDDVVMAMAITFADEPRRPATLILTSPQHDNLQPSETSEGSPPFARRDCRQNLKISGLAFSRVPAAGG